MIVLLREELEGMTVSDRATSANWITQFCKNLRRLDTHSENLKHYNYAK